MTLYDLPGLNASLNAASTVFIALGWWFIRRDRKPAHIVCMVGALLTSTVFLACYLTYHLQVTSVKFTEPGIIRPIYFFILITHIILAAATLPLVVMTVIPALRARFDKHRRMGRITMPVWLYVSVTGVLVYFMLYQWFPPDEVLRRRTLQTFQQ
jgi:putative membrane protein